jgi:hypothetical protein
MFRGILTEALSLREPASKQAASRPQALCEELYLFNRVPIDEAPTIGSRGRSPHILFNLAQSWQESLCNVAQTPDVIHSHISPNSPLSRSRGLHGYYVYSHRHWS